MSRRTLLVGATLGASALHGAAAHADVDAVRLLDAGALATSRGIAPAFAVPGAGLSLLVRVPDEASARAAGLLPVAPGFAVLRGDVARVAGLATAHPDWLQSWAPPRRPLLDQATSWTRSGEFRKQTGGSGKGVVVGVVDTGVDAAHGDFLDADGHTRVAWYIDYSRAPAGRQHELEVKHGCSGQAGHECAVFSGADLDELAGNSVKADEPQDGSGHGTHVASLAAGNGRSNPTPKYVGVAPDATLVVARVTRSQADAIRDTDIVAGTSFVFERAAALSLPAVVNLSLGSDFGPHDGSSALEQALVAMLGPDQPGRAIVVAAGNSATLRSGLSSSYPEPLGVHTELHVPAESSVRVPLLVPKSDDGPQHGQVYIWIAERPSDRLEVGFDDGSGEWIAPLEPGHGGTFERDEGKLRVTILNASRGEGSPLTASNGAVVVLDGDLPSDETFAVRLAGHGTASLWVQSEGDLGPGGDSTGVLFPLATKEGTINVPASAPELIAAGASVNRDSWRDRHGRMVSPPLGSDSTPDVDGLASFSAAGPTATGVIKPDLVAPGAFLVGAMAFSADPKQNGGLGIFGPSHCENGTDCLAVDNFHAIAQGTSMAAPQVAGAIALLFERDPTLTGERALVLLQAGARRPSGAAAVEQQMGPGALDLVGALAAQSPDDVVRAPAASESWLVVSASYAHPDPEWLLSGLVELRDAKGALADGFERRRLELAAAPARVVVPLTRQAPGLWKFQVACPEGSGGGTLALSVSFDGQSVASKTLPIAVDRWAADHGFTAKGGCAVGARAGPSAWVAAAALAVVGLRRRRRQGQ